eukprot:9503884-Pyramimonas_sp.AAC.2
MEKKSAIQRASPRCPPPRLGCIASERLSRCQSHVDSTSSACVDGSRMLTVPLALASMSVAC